MQPTEPVTVTAVQVKQHALSPSAYVLLSLPLGIFYYCFVAAGLALSIGLLPLWIGFPILLGVLLAIERFGRYERSAAKGVLGEYDTDSGSGDDADPSSPPKSGIFSNLGRLLARTRTYAALLLLVLKLPIGIVNFVVSVAFASTGIALIFTPVVYFGIQYFLEVNIFENNILMELFPIDLTPLQQSLMCSAIGIVMLLFSYFVIKLLSAISARLTLLILRS